MKKPTFFNELKRRNVYKVAVAYAVVSWLLVQAASILFPTFDAPSWVMKVLVAVIVIGFPLALILSWAFEITPEGIKREEDVSPNESITRRTGRKIVGITIIVAVLAMGLFIFQQLRPHLTSSGLSSATRMSASEGNKRPNEKSVAVLAFDNLSDDKGSEYFSDGISEELLTVLQKIPGLHVAARTSAFSFKGKNATAQEIGQKLGVAHLVEGSVRKAGDVVRIAARLTQANTGEEQWSENYTRKLKDVFAVQTELAQTIVEQLKGQLGGEATNPEAKAAIHAQVQSAEKGGTKNVEAHEAYLQGRFFLNRHSEKETDQAKTAFERAVQLDPKFALAWAGLAQTNVWYCNFSGEGGLNAFNAHLAAAREAVERALSIEPDLPEALLPLATIKINFDHDWKGAAETLRKGLALAPQDAALLAWAGNIAFVRGEGPQSVDLLRRAIALDPVNAQSRVFLAGTLSSLGRQEEARAEYARAIELNPSAPYSHAGMGTTYLLEGKFEEAATFAQKDAADYARRLVLSCARWAQKRIPESDAALAELIENDGESAAYQIAEAYAYRNDKDRAFEWLERAYRQRDAGLVSLLLDSFFPNLHSDPRWDALLHKMGLADDQLK
ncbi:MAG TPA: tetratricopeptide repeat protein [Candidatus Udaeobacter sp.]|jgi:serine/threonine-protein kinase|nr:tetratricopeptide repeat protein [Candidatus Udaeobacter sp.]